MILGIDEAGRGPIIGPMVIAGVCFDQSDLLFLKELGIKESKLLSPVARERLFKEIIKIAKRYRIYKIPPKEIDQAVFSSLKITGLEAKYIASIIEELDAEEVYIDSPINNPSKFLSILRKFLKKEYRIVCEIKADLNYLQVAAASIIAKVIRDSEIRNLQAKYGDFGSGYPSDPKTIAFLKSLLNENLEIEEVRKSWKTLRRLSP